jgi:GTP cyclohydrolase II
MQQFLVKCTPFLYPDRLSVTTKHIATAKLPTRFGEFTIVAFEDDTDGKEHIALVYGDPANNQPCLMRIHSECLTGDALFSLRCDCGPQLEAAMMQIAAQGHGVILYLRQEGRNIGLLNKIRAYALQDAGADTVDANLQLGFEADERGYDMCKPMLEHLGISRVKLLTNNPRKVKALENMGIEVSERQPLLSAETSYNAQYLATKRSRLGHIPE